MNPLNDLGYRPEDLHVQVTELLVATADDTDELVDLSVSQVLRLLRERMKMDVVFVSEFTDGQRVMRQVAAGDPPVVKPGDAAPLEAGPDEPDLDGFAGGVPLLQCCVDDDHGAVFVGAAPSVRRRKP